MPAQTQCEKNCCTRFEISDIIYCNLSRREAAIDLDNFGFIHGELDIKILILYILRKLPSPISGQALEQLCLFDGGMSYFDYVDCLAHLVETGHVEEVSPGKYEITEKGARNGETAESSLPYSVRLKADRRVAPVASRMERDSLIESSHEAVESGYTVRMALSDGKGKIFSLEILTADEDQAELMEKNFRHNAEEIYGSVAKILLD